ncbi:MAG TPA: hypothetical protein DHV59_02655 [Oxalobacteraceae bacterium]|nr:hypothetical protein [Oxalobacteraceae bacterium]
MSIPCNRCKRTGLLLLPVLYSVNPKDVETGMKPLASPFGEGLIDKKLDESSYVLRAMDPGYIYLLYPNNHWQGFMVDAKGYLAWYPDLEIEDMPTTIPEKSDVAACESQGKSHTGVESLCINAPHLIKGTVYIAYSRHKWTKAVRNQYSKNPSSRMQKIAKLDGSPFPHAQVMAPSLLQMSVLDYNENAVKALNKSLPQDAQVEDRSGRAESLFNVMFKSSGDLKVPGLIMALCDPIGMTAKLNQRRNDIVEQVLLLDQKTSETERADMLVAGVIEDLREGMQKNGGDWERHAKHIDMTKLEAVKKKMDQRRKLATRVDAMSADYVAWMTAAPTQEIFSKDFDKANSASSLALESSFAICTIGSGTTKVERDRVWQPWFDKQPEDETNLLWKAATANDPSLLTYVAWNKVDKTFDAIKGAKDAFKEAPWYAHAQEALSARAQRKGQQRAHTLATEKITQTLAAQLLWLRDRDQKKFLRTAAQMATVLMARGDLVMLPKTITSRMSQYIRWQQEAWLGKPTVKAPLRINPAGSRTSPKHIDPSKISDTELRQEVQSLHGALMIDLSGKDGVMTFTAWAAARLQPGQAPGEAMQKLLKQLKMNPADLTMSADFKINPLTEGALNVRSAKLDRAFSSGTAFLQFISFFNTANDLSDELKKGKDADSLKVTSSVAGMLGACATVIAAGMEIKAAGNIVVAGGASSFGTKVLLGGAAGIGLVVGLADAYFLWKSADKLAAEGDKDAANLTLWSARFTAGSAGFAASAGIASLIFGFTGIGLAVLVVGAVVFGIAAMVFGFRGNKATDTELEKWLDRCRFGKRERPDSKSPFKDLEAEMLGLRSAIYIIAISLEHLKNSGTLQVFYKATVPYYASSTKLRVEVWGQDTWGKDHLLTHTVFTGESSLPKENVDRKVAPVSEISMKLQEDKTLRIDGEVLVRRPPSDLSHDPRSGKQFIPVGTTLKNVSDVIYIKEMRIVVQYQPDIKTWPDFAVEARV